MSLVLVEVRVLSPTPEYPSSEVWGIPLSGVFVNVEASTEALDRFARGAMLQTSLSPEIVDQLSPPIED